MASCGSIASVSEAREESSTYWHRSVEPGGAGCRKVSQGKPVLWDCPGCHLYKHSRVPGHWKSRRGEAALHSACQPSWCARAVSPSQAPHQPGPKQAAPSPAPCMPPSSLLAPFPQMAPVLGQPWSALWGRLDTSAVLQPGYQVRSNTALCQKAKLMFCTPVKFSKPEVPFPPRILSVTKHGLETPCLNTTVWIFFLWLWRYDFICLISWVRDSQLKWEGITRTKVSIHPGQKNWNHLCLKYTSCASPAKQLLKRHWFNELQSQKTGCQPFCPFPQPVIGADRTHFPPREV